MQPASVSMLSPASWCLLVSQTRFLSMHTDLSWDSEGETHVVAEWLTVRSDKLKANDCGPWSLLWKPLRKMLGFEAECRPSDDDFKMKLPCIGRTRAATFGHRLGGMAHTVGSLETRSSLALPPERESDFKISRRRTHRLLSLYRNGFEARATTEIGETRDVGCSSTSVAERLMRSRARVRMDIQEFRIQALGKIYSTCI